MHVKARRPRVAAIGLDDSQLASIEFLCGELRPSVSVDDYLNSHSWTETDVVLSSALCDYDFDSSVNLMTIGAIDIYWHQARSHSPIDFAATDDENTDRELTIPPHCPDLYKSLAAELSTQLGRAAEPPAVVNTSKQDWTGLIETTSGHPVAVRLVLPTRSGDAEDEQSRPIGLLLPEGSHLVTWFRAFLCDLHECDPIRVPEAPPRLGQPSDWYTPEERALAGKISQIESELERLSSERDELVTKLTAEGEKADRGIRRVLWADGDALIDAVKDILRDLGFAVRDMDVELSQGEPKREDLRLTLKDSPKWQAIVEVKGYTKGTRTNDAERIRKYRERYLMEEGQPPDLTIWLSNPNRTTDDPSSRPAPDQNVKESSKTVGAVHVLASDLYRQWALVGAGSLDAETVVESLKSALPGLWTPPIPHSGT